MMSTNCIALIITASALVFGVAAAPMAMAAESTDSTEHMTKPHTDAMKGDAMKGDAMKGDAMKGDAMKGDAMKGHAMKGDAMKGDAMKAIPRRASLRLNKTKPAADTVLPQNPV